MLRRIHTKVVERVQHQVESGKPVGIELAVFDVRMDGCYFTQRVEGGSRTRRDLARSFGSDAPSRDPKQLEEPTIAFACFTSLWRNKNCLFKFDKSIVSRSSSVTSPNPARATFLTLDGRTEKLNYATPKSKRDTLRTQVHLPSSQPIPPAPTISKRVCTIFSYKIGPRVACA
jgi:hypothetical protein